MDIKATHNISFGTNISKTARNQLKSEISKSRQVVKWLENDGLDDFTMVNKNLITTSHPAYGEINIKIPQRVYQLKTPIAISQAITDAAINEYMRYTGEYPIS